MLVAEVRSLTDPRKWYRVSCTGKKSAPTWECSCPAWQFHKQVECKHIRGLMKQTLPEDGVVMTERGREFMNETYCSCGKDHEEK